MSRDAILRDVREALKTPMSDGQSAPKLVPLAKPPDLIEAFRATFEAADGVWHQADGIEGAARYIQSIANGKVWSTVDGIPLGARPENPASIEATVTHADVAIAETGTFAFLARPGQGRLSSLIAPVHIVLVRREQFVAGLDEWLSWLQPRLRSQAVLVTGPSRSADIEQVITIGVHGPGKVYGVLYA